MVLLAGANPAETMPPLMQHLRDAQLVVIDPRRTATAESAALHLRPAPGTDLALVLGLLHIAVVDTPPTSRTGPPVSTPRGSGRRPGGRSASSASPVFQ